MLVHALADGDDSHADGRGLGVGDVVRDAEGYVGFGDDVLAKGTGGRAIGFDAVGEAGDTGARGPGLGCRGRAGYDCAGEVAADRVIWVGIGYMFPAGGRC